MAIRLDSIRPASRRIRFGAPFTVFIEVKRILGSSALRGTITLSCAQDAGNVTPAGCEVRVPKGSERAVVPVEITLAGGGLTMAVIRATLTDGGPEQVQSCLLEVVDE